jgi:PAS domain S-box-containing protein
MTVERHNPGNFHTAAFQAGRLLVIFAPILAVGIVTICVAVVAGRLGFYPEEMYAVASGFGAFLLLLAVFLFFREATERRAAAAALQNAEARVGDIAGSAMDPIISVDESQQIIFFNAAAERVFRWPRAAVLGQSLDMLIPERLRTAHRGHLDRFGREGAAARPMGPLSVLTGLRADGEEFPIEASISSHTESGQRIFTVVLRDVTNWVQSEKLRASNEARLQGILESAMDAIITIDENERVVLFNAAAEAVFGCRREHALGAPLAWFIPERFRAGHGEHIRRFADDSTMSRRMGATRIVTGLRNNGEEFPIDASISKTEEGGRKFFTVILRDVTERVRAEHELRASQQELRELSVAADGVVEEERGRVARELHDELGQALTTLKLEVSWLAANPDENRATIMDKLAGMDQLLDATIGATRRISSDLRPLMLDDLGLVPAAEWLVENFSARTGIVRKINLDDDLDLGEPYASAVFRILQESLTNIARHAGASHVEVNLRRVGDGVELAVRDDGAGFDPGVAGRKSFGLRGQRERVRILGGEFELQSAPGLGTTMRAYFPLTGAQP